MEKDIIKQFGELKDRINELGVSHSNYIDTQHRSSTNDITSTAQMLTDIEIAEIEQAQMLTDHDIAIIELQQKIGG